MHAYFYICYRAYMFLFMQKGRSILHLCMFVLSIHYISLLFDLFFTPLLMIDKMGERNLKNVFEFICMFRNSENDFEFICMFTYSWYHICMFIFTIDIVHIVFVYAKGEKYSSLMHACVEHSLHIFMFIAMHELRENFYEA